MSQPNLKVLSRIAVLEPGLYIFRYTAESASQSCISLHQAPIGRGSVDFFPSEGVTRNTLNSSGDCVIARVKGAASSVLIVEYHPTNAETGSIQLQIERIETSPQSHRTQAATAIDTQLPSEQQSCSTVLPVTLLGHIERRGDITVHEGKWLGDPQGNQRIEGFSAACDSLPEGVILAYSCRSAKDSAPHTGLAGQFVGTRSQALPITAAGFTLSGPKAADFVLEGQLVFAGQMPIALLPGKEHSGPTGHEQLVALRLTIRSKAAQTPPPASPWSDPSTQIFRS